MSFDPTLTARVAVEATADIAGIIKVAGGDPWRSLYANGYLTVRGITQDALEAAAAPADLLFGVRQDVKQRAKAEFDRRVAAGMPFRGKTADMDEVRSQPRLTGAVAGAIIARQANQPFVIEWRMADNTFLSLDAQSVIIMGQMVLSYFGALNAWYWQIADRAMGAPDMDEIRAIDPLAGWPEPPVEPPVQG